MDSRFCEPEDIPLWRIPFWEAFQKHHWFLAGAPLCLGALFPSRSVWVLLLGYAAAVALFQARRHRLTILFQARYLNLHPRVSQIEGLRQEILSELLRSDFKRLPAQIPDFLHKLEQLSERARDLGLALQRLRGGRTRAEVDRQLAHMIPVSEGARAHLLREREAHADIEAQRNRIEAQLLTLSQFFLAAEAEMRSILGRMEAHRADSGTQLLEETGGIIDGVFEVERCLAELEQESGSSKIQCRPTARKPCH